jgi:hypothetical protein
MDHSRFTLNASDITIGASNRAEVPLSLGESSKQIEVSHVVCVLTRIWSGQPGGDGGDGGDGGKPLVSNWSDDIVSNRDE